MSYKPGHGLAIQCIFILQIMIHTIEMLFILKEIHSTENKTGCSVDKICEHSLKLRNDCPSHDQFMWSVIIGARVATKWSNKFYILFILLSETTTAVNPLDVEVMWEYKWDDEGEEELFGPYTSTQMQQWVDDGYFKSGVMVRKAGQDGDFFSSRRIEFDLYT
jgi:hypothetical protein